MQTYNYKNNNNNNNNDDDDADDDDFDLILENMDNLDIPEPRYLGNNNNVPSSSSPLLDLMTNPMVIRHTSSEDSIVDLVGQQQELQKPSNTSDHFLLGHRGSASDVDDASKRFSFSWQEDNIIISNSNNNCDEIINRCLEPIMLSSFPLRVVSCSDESTTTSSSSACTMTERVTSSMRSSFSSSSLSPSSSVQGVEFPPDFVPSNYHIICAKGKKNYNHIGNRRFRVTLEIFLGEYKKAKTKAQKGVILTNVVDLVRSNGGGFVRQDKSQKWYEVGDHLAREKVGEYFRALTLNPSVFRSDFAQVGVEASSSKRKRGIDTTQQESQEETKRQRMF